MKERLAQHFSVTPFVQVAPGGEWERAVRLTGDEDAAAILETMSHGAKHIGMEVMWPGHAFAGTGWPAASWGEGTAAAARVHRARPASLEAGLLALLGSPPTRRARLAQVGAVNAWSSVGAENLWREGETYSPDRTDAILDRRPDLASTCRQPVAVEFGLSGDQPAWVAFMVSEPGGPVDRERLHDIVRSVVS